MIPPADEVLEIFSGILESGIITNNGPVVRRFEEELKGYAGTGHALTTANGTLALHLAIRGLGLAGDIITTPLTFVATSSAIRWEGCRPVFADIDADTLCLDPFAVEEMINENTVCIMPVHLYGNVCEIDAFEDISRRYGIPVIYDAAQAFGSLYEKRPVVSYGTVSMLSLHAYKILSSIEGGVLFTDNEDLSEDIFRIRYFGKDRDNREVMLGMNAKMSEFNAGYGLVSMAHAGEELSLRKNNYSVYLSHLGNDKRLKFPCSDKRSEPNYAYMPIVLPDEDCLERVMLAGERANIEFKRYFYPALNTMEFLNAGPDRTPVASGIADRILCLPNYGDLTADDIGQISRVILTAL